MVIPERSKLESLIGYGYKVVGAEDGFHKFVYVKYNYSGNITKFGPIPHILINDFLEQLSKSHTDSLKWAVESITKMKPSK